MKRNWGLAAGILAFIVIYQLFVLSPYTKKQQALAIAATAHQPTAPGAPGTTAVVAAPVAPTIASPVAAVSQPINNVAMVAPKTMTLSLGTQRSVRISGNTLEAAVLDDFFPLHGKKTDKKEILPQGVSIQSTNEKVQKCFLSMKQLGDAASFVGTNGAGTCKLTYTPDKDHRSVLNIHVGLEGFASEAGEFYLKFHDSLGSAQTLDQNFLTYRLDASKKSLRGKDLFKGARFTGKLDWLAWGDRYFSAIFIPRGNYNPSVYVDNQENMDAKNAESASTFGLIYPLNPEKIQGAYAYDYTFYFGTRDPRVLEDIDPLLAETVDLGFFAVIARVMLWFLHAFNHVFHNYGVSIIALTVLMRLMFWPLNRKAYASTMAMKTIQPQVALLKEKYGKDPAKAAQMNTEMMQLYKKNKVNPLGGCLPMLLQIPIFIGLYAALNHSIDLYGAPFFGWIQNLSDKDPYYILPGLWTLSLIGYALLNPQTSQSQPGMPDMKWMFMGMNVFFGYLSSNWPSGLTLYLFVSNLVGVTQQVMMRRDTKKLSVIQEGAN